MKPLIENKQSSVQLKISQSEKILFEKLQLEADNDAEEFERKPRRYHHRSSSRKVPQ